MFYILLKIINIIVFVKDNECLIVFLSFLIEIINVIYFNRDNECFIF